MYFSFLLKSKYSSFVPKLYAIQSWYKMDIAARGHNIAGMMILHTYVKHSSNLPHLNVEKTTGAKTQRLAKKLTVKGLDPSSIFSCSHHLRIEQELQTTIWNSKSSNTVDPEKVNLLQDLNTATSTARYGNTDRSPGPSMSDSPGPDLEKIASQLTDDISNFFMKAQNWNMYHKEMVLQDNIRGVKFVGLERYKMLVNIMRIIAHIRFLYVKMTILSVTKEKQGTISVRWRVVGLGLMKMLVRYFPDRLWEKGSMERIAPVYFDGYSTYYVNSESKIYQHTVDRVMEDKDKGVRKSVFQKLSELGSKSGTQPAL